MIIAVRAPLVKQKLPSTHAQCRDPASRPTLHVLAQQKCTQFPVTFVHLGSLHTELSYLLHIWLDLESSMDHIYPYVREYYTFPPMHSGTRACLFSAQTIYSQHKEKKPVEQVVFQCTLSLQPYFIRILFVFVLQLWNISISKISGMKQPETSPYQILIKENLFQVFINRVRLLNCTVSIPWLFEVFPNNLNKMGRQTAL